MSSDRGSRTPIFLTGWVCIALFALWHILAPSSDSSSSVAAGLLLLASLAASRYALGLPFTSAPLLYLALLGLFHLGLVVPWALGIYDIGRIPWFAPYGLSRAIALITYSIISFQIGLVLATWNDLSSRKPIPAGNRKIEDKHIFIAGSSLFLVGLIAFIVGLIRLDPVGYYRLSYSETFRLRAESDPRFFGLGLMIVFIGLSLSAAGATRRQLRITFLSACVWVTLLFYLGFRGPAIIAGLIVYAVAVKKRIEVPAWIPSVVVAIVLVAVPVMRFSREQPLNQRSLPNSLNEFNILDTPAEMGASIRPLIETADLIGPGNYRFGRTYLIGIKAIAPNLAFRWEAPATESLDDLPPGHWITAMVDPWTYKNYGGIGFSAVAEPYMNFGALGVVAYFLLLAFMLVRLEQASIRSSYALAIWALVLGPLLWTTRNDSANFFRPAAWGLLCIGLVWAGSQSYSLIVQRRGVE
jgi:oligosaccharide repeat unit polymerase